MLSNIFHIDVNSAYLSWSSLEVLKENPALDLRTIPAIIGGDQSQRRGVVLAKSIPAKKYGIKTGEPVSHAFQKCPHLVTHPPSHQLYAQYSKALMDFLYTLTPNIEKVSIDECFLYYDDIVDKSPHKTPVETANWLRDSIYQKFGFTVNIGVSTNKLLAKMASDFEKPHHVHTLYLSEIKEKMWPLPVSQLFMAGKSSVTVLEKLELNTIGDLAQADLSLLSAHLKSHGKLLWEYANGIGSDVLHTEPMKAKGIGNSLTLSEDAASLEESMPILIQLANSVSRRLKKAEQIAYSICLEIKYYDFTSVSHQTQVSIPTDDAKTILNTAITLFHELWNGTPIRLLGIRTTKLVATNTPIQLSLFDIDLEKEQKKRDLESAMKTIKKKYGEQAIQKGFLDTHSPHHP